MQVAQRQILDLDGVVDAMVRALGHFAARMRLIWVATDQCSG